MSTVKLAFHSWSLNEIMQTKTHIYDEIRNHNYIYKVRVCACMRACIRAYVFVQYKYFAKRHDIDTNVLVNNTSRFIRPRQYSVYSMLACGHLRPRKN